MKLFEKNLAAIRGKEPELADILARLPECQRIAREVGQAGEVTIKVKGTDGSGSIDISDANIPSSDSIADGLADKRMVVVMGFASGGLLCEVARRTSDQTFILLIEPDVDLFAAMLKEIDFSKTLEKENISLAIGESAQAATFIRAEKEYGVFIQKDFMTIENKWSAPLYKSYFVETKRKLYKLKEFGLQNITTVLNLSGVWQKNILTNIPFIIKTGSVADLFGKFDQVPAVVVAAGPSLDKTLIQLTALKHRGVIIAVDTAVRALLAAGLEPDIVVSLDGKYENYLHLKGITLPNTLFVLNPSVHPMIATEHVGPSVFLSYCEPLFLWLEKIIGEKGDVRAGGSVATSAFDLAVKMGCSPVILTGQDMAYSGGQSHAGATMQDTMRNGAKLTFDDPDTYSAMDIFGTAVVTTFKMDSWRQWYELIVDRESPPALNATEGGLNISGMKNVSMAEAVTLALAKDVRVSQIIPEISSDGQSYAKPLIEALTKARDEARTVKNVCGKGMSIAKKSIDTAKSEPSQEGDGNNDQREMEELSKEIMKQEIFAETNRWSIDITLGKVEQISRSKSIGENRKNLTTIAQAFLVLFSDLYRIASSFEKLVSETLKTLKSYKLQSIESLK